MATTGNDPPDQEDRTLHTPVCERDVERIDATLAVLDRGETPAACIEATFHDPNDSHRMTRPQNLELLRAIVQHAPERIRETARIVDRDVRPVHRNLAELEELHPIELVDDGQAERPLVWYDAIDIDLDLVTPPVSSAANARAPRTPTATRG